MKWREQYKDKIYKEEILFKNDKKEGK